MKFEYLEVDISDAMFKSAQNRNKSNYKKLGTKGTLLTQKNEQIRKNGFLGEEIVKKIFPELEFSTNPEFDFFFKNKTFEVKAVGTNTPPKPYYDVTILAYQKERSADYFIFTRILNSGERGYILGFISKEEFFKKARLVKKGETNQNFTYDSDRYCLPVDKLHSVRVLEQLILEE